MEEKILQGYYEYATKQIYLILSNGILIIVSYDDLFLGLDIENYE
jgi:hypothetical protein